jgi:Zn-dependent protease with chaperone function
VKKDGLLGALSCVSIGRFNLLRGSMKFARFAIALITLALSPIAFGKAHYLSRPQSTPVLESQPAPSAAIASRPVERKISSYTLPPALYQKAKALSRTQFRFNIISFFYGVLILWIILHWKLGPKFRDTAEKASSNRFIQALVFTLLLVLTIAILQIPADAYEHWVSLSYGISVERWGAWLLDYGKAQLLLIVGGSLAVWILYLVIRRSPRRWWFYFWLISLPIIVFLSFIEPFVIEPMFFTFAPLSQKDPELVTQIERVVQRAGLSIPPDRMFWMKASEKTNAMNAYVSGLGASKRVVVWDTNIAKESIPEILSDFGHEMGHYVLNHIWKDLAFTAALLFVLFYLGFRCLDWMLKRWGRGWGIRGPDDLASLPALLLLLSIFNFAADPISNAFSRYIENQADVYGLEVTHGVIPDAGQAAADSFQVEGESFLADPDPNPVDVFWFYDHPPISDRVKLCLTYDPWSKGERPQFVK